MFLSKTALPEQITGLDGRFSILAAKGNVIEFSYVGYTTKYITVGDASSLTVVLDEDTKALDEVVVTALGIKRAEKALSYSVQQVKSDAINSVKDANFVNGLTGKVAGVSINRSSSGIGGATRVVMRGAKSIVGNNNVLYVVDGMPIGNPQKVKSIMITVLREEVKAFPISTRKTSRVYRY